MSAIAVVGDSVGGATIGLTASAVIPGSASAGNFALACLTFHNNPATPPTPAGWVRLGQITLGGVDYGIAYGKILTNTDPGSTLSITFATVNGRWSLAIRVWSGNDTGALTTDTAGGAVANLTAPLAFGATPATTHTTNSIPSVSVANCWAIWAIGERGGPSSTTFTVSSGQMQSTSGSYQTGNSLGSTSTGIADSAGTVATGTVPAVTFTGTASTASGWTIAFTLKPNTATSTTAVGYAPNQLANTLFKAAQSGANAGTFRLRLLDPTYAIDLNNHNFWADVSSHEMPTANGYTVGGKALTTVTYSFSGTTLICMLTSDPVTWSIGAGLDLIPRYGALVIDTGTAATSPIMAIVDSGGATDAQTSLTFNPDPIYGWIGSDQPVHG